MDQPQVIDIGAVVDQQNIGAFNIKVIVIAWFLVLIDGYDIFVPGFLGPQLIRAWHIQPSSLAPMFTAGLVGIMIGAPLFGWVGDRYGRKRSILIGSMLYGGLSLASIWTRTIEQMVYMRLAIGVAMGGIIPCALALAAEYAPKRLRATLVVCVCVGASIGLLLPGIIATFLIPIYGWPVLLVIGGIGPILIGMVAQFSLPESIKYLAVEGHRDGEIRRLLKIMQPKLLVPENVTFTVAGLGIKPEISPRQLFTGGLAPITLAIWLAFAILLMTNILIASWLPTLMQSVGATTQQQATAIVGYGLGGLTGGLLMTRLIDRFGTTAFTYFFALSVPCVALLGWPSLSPLNVTLLAFGAGITVSGMAVAFNTTLGMIYPTPLRSKGIGWGLSVGRLGSALGPALGGVLVGMHMTNLQIFIAPAVLQALGAVVCFYLTRQCVRRFQGRTLDEKAPASLVLDPRADIASTLRVS